MISALPNAAEFNRLREHVGWGVLADDQAALALANSLFSAVVYHQGELIGMGRVVGDGAVYFYVQDVAVHADWQGQGVGDAVMQAIEQLLLTQAPPGASVGLLAALGKEPFYARYGFAQRDGQAHGFGMSKVMAGR